MRRRAIVTTLAVLALAAQPVAAASAAPTPAPSPSPTASPSSTAVPRKGDGTLQILTFRGYTEYGSTSPGARWAADFEADTGCRIARLDQVQTREEMTRRLAERSYDVISAGPDLVGSLIEGKQVRQLEPSKIDGYGELSKKLRDLTAKGDKVYGVPYLWGRTS